MLKRKFVWFLAVGSVALAALGSAVALGRSSVNREHSVPPNTKSIRATPQSSDAGYWTAKRMREAKPLPMELGGGVPPASADAKPDGRSIPGSSAAPPAHP